MKFNVFDESGQIAMCGLSKDNVYINAYPKILGEKAPGILEVGESVKALYQLSGGRGVYFIQRVE